MKGATGSVNIVIPPKSVPAKAKPVGNTDRELKDDNINADVWLLWSLI